MTKSILISLATLAIYPATAKTAEEIAKELVVPELKVGDQSLQLPKSPGAVIELQGVDYEEIIHPNGKISPVISDTPVKVSFKVTKDGKEVLSPDYPLVVKAKASTEGNEKPKVIPEILQWQGSKGEYALGNTITLECKQDFAQELVKELHEITGKTVKLTEKSGNAQMRIQVIKDKSLGKEGYKLSITPKGVGIAANDRVGLYWGTRTLLQMLKQNPESLPCGNAIDFPRYALRGFMLDIARTPYPLSYLKDIIRTMAWYKMNDLHLVINNNYIFHEHYVDKGQDPFKLSYSAFRLESEAKGKDGTPLTAQDLSYTKKEFADLIDYAKKYRVQIVPEFDTPGHALSFTRLRPDLIYKGPMNHEKRRCEMLDAGNTETLKFVTEIYDEYLMKNKTLGKPVFEGIGAFHVGADEFYGDPESYRQFSDGVLKHTIKRGFTPRIWGSLSSKPGKTPVVAKGVEMNLWNTGWMKASDAIEQGFDIINTNDGALYIVPFAGYYRMDRNHKGLYESWIPNKIGQEVVASGHPQLKGATFAVWNDETDVMHSGYAPYDILGSITDSMNILSQKMWGKAEIPRPFDQHQALAKSIGNAPLTNPYYQWKDKTPVELQELKLPYALNKPSLGPNYRISMQVELLEAPEGQEQVLLSAPEGKFLAVMKDGTIGFRRDDTLEFSFGIKLPIGEKVNLEIVGEPENTRVFVNGREAKALKPNNYRKINGEFKQEPKQIRSTFVAPLKSVGESFRGKVHQMTIKPQ